MKPQKPYIPPAKKKRHISDHVAASYFHSMAGLIPEAVIMVDDQHLVTNWNMAAERIYGWNINDLLGKPLNDFLRTNYGTSSLSETKEEAAKTGIWSGEVTQARKDGTRIPVHSSVSVLKDEQGSPIGFISINRDISEQKKAEADLRESQSILNTAEEVAKIGSWKWDLHTQKVTWSDEMFHLFEVEREGFDGDLGRVISERIHPDDAAIVNESNRKVMEEDTPTPLSYRIVLPNGTERTVWAQGKLFRDEAGQPMALTGYVQDITERVRTEKKLTQIKRLYATLSEINQTIVRVKDREDLYQSICNVAVQFGEFSLAWIGLLDETSGQVKSVAANGLDVSQWPFQTVDIEKDALKNELVATAIRTSKVATSDDIRNGTKMQFLRDQLSNHNYHSSAVIPFQLRGRTVGVVNLISHEVGLFKTESEVNLLEEMRLDISFALDMLETKAERKQAEEALLIENERFVYFSNSNIVGIVIAEASGKIILANDYYLKLLAVNRQDFIDGKVDWRKFTPPEWLSMDEKAIRELREHGVCEPYEKEYVRADGTRVSVYITDTMLPGPGEQIAAFIIDITERKQAEKKLQVHERTLKLFVEYAPAAIAMFDHDMHYIAASRRYLTDYRLADENIVGCSHYDIFPEMPERWKQIHRNCLAGAIEKAEEDPFPRADGTLDWVHWEIHPWYDNSGVIGGIILFSEVVTERKKAEHTLRIKEQAIRSSLNAIAIADLTGELTYINTAFLRLWGYDHESEVLGKSVLQFWNQREKATEVIEAVQNQDGWVGELTAKRKDDSLADVQLTASVLKDELGQPIGMVAAFMDISERKLAEHEVEHRNEDLMLINALNEAVNRGEDISGIVEVFANETRKTFACQDVAIYLLSTDAKYIELQSTTLSRKLSEKIEKLIGRPIPKIQIPIKEDGYFKQILSNEQGIITSDPKVIQQWISEFAETTFLPSVFRPAVRKLVPQIYKNLNLRSTIAIPLISSGRTIGILDMSSKGQFTEEDLRRIRTISYQMTAVVLRKQAEKQVELQLRRMSALSEIDRAISSSLDMRLSLDVLLNEVRSQLGVDAATVLLLNTSSQMLEYFAGKGFRTLGIRQSSLRLGEGLAGHAGLERKLVHVSNLSESTRAQARRAELLKDENFTEYYGVPLIAKGLLKGILEVFHRSPLGPDPEWMNYLETLAGQAAIAIDNAQLFEGMQRSNLELITAYDATIEGWSRALDLRDKETEGHSLRVTELTVQLAKRMGVNQQDIVQIRRGALLHDIGKLGVPDHILHKPTELDRIEWAIMRQHPTYAFNMLLPINYLRSALDIPYCHHEKWDGSGYPRGLKGEEIPLAARIFAVVDVWDALHSNRPYRSGWEIEKTREYIIEESGKHFDPQVVEAFLEQLDKPVDTI